MSQPTPIRELIAAATPGPWTLQGSYVGSYEATICDCDVSSISTPERKKANQQLIARLSPDVVLAVVEALDATTGARNPHSLGVAMTKAEAALRLLDGRK